MWAEGAIACIGAATLAVAFFRYMSGPRLFPRYAPAVGLYVAYALMTVALAVIYRNEPLDVLRDAYQLLPLPLALFLPLIAQGPADIRAVVTTVIVLFLAGVPAEIQSGLEVRPIYQGLALPLSSGNLPKSLALHWSTVAPFGLAALLLAKHRSARLGAIALLAAAAIAAFFSLSRAAIAATLFGCTMTALLIGMFHPKRVKAIAKVALVGVVLGLLILSSSDLLTGAGEYLLDSFRNPLGVSSLKTRISNNELMMDQALRSYLFGYGLGYRIAVVYRDVGETRALTPDNSFLYILVKFGLVGLGLYVHSLLQMVRSGWRVAASRDEAPAWRIYAFGYLGAIVSLVVNSLFNNSAVIFSGNLFLGLSTGILGWRMLEMHRSSTRGMAQ